MAFVNEDGVLVSFECTELIKELKEDILEFGGDKIVAVWCKEYEGVVLYTNYDFIAQEMPIQKNELKNGEKIIPMTMSALLILLEKQNKV